MKKESSGALRRYFEKQNIEFTAKRVFIDGLGGMALGLFQNHSYVILAISVILVLICIRIIRRIKPTGLAAASVSMIAGGALGNMIDRLAYGYVIDMFELLFMDFYIFNVADVGVVLGAILCFVSLQFRPQDWRGQ